MLRMAVRGDAPLRIMQRAGHTTLVPGGSVSAFGVAAFMAQPKTRVLSGGAQESNLPETTYAASHRF
jgi:hypothetical protein